MKKKLALFLSIVGMGIGSCKSSAPDHVHVGNTRYSIQLVGEKEIPGLWGQCHGKKKEIKIREDLSHDATGIVYIHEVLHAIFFEIPSVIHSNPGLEEYIVGLISEPLYRSLTYHGFLLK